MYYFKFDGNVLTPYTFDRNLKSKACEPVFYPQLTNIFRNKCFYADDLEQQKVKKII